VLTTRPLLAALTTADKAGIDAPCGWPDAFAVFLAAHLAGDVPVPGGLTGQQWRRQLAWRHTDETVRAATGIIPPQRCGGQDRACRDALRRQMTCALAGHTLGAVAEGRPPVAIPCHLEYARVNGPRPFTRKPGRKGRSGAERSGTKASVITLRKVACCCDVRFFQFPLKAGKASQMSASDVRSAEVVEVSEHVVRRLVHSPAVGGDLTVGFLLSGQPLRSEEPCLVGWDGHKTADGDRPVIMQGELDVVSLADVQARA